jgi:hypothetical protein
MPVAHFLGRSRINERRGLAAFLITLAMTAAIFSLSVALDIPAIALVALAVTVVAAVIPTRIHVGHEGVRVSWLKSRFFSYADVLDVGERERDIALTLSNGTRVVLPIASKNPTRGDAEKKAKLLDELRLRLESYKRNAAGRSVDGFIARYGGDTRAIVSALRAGEGAGAYRVEAVDADTLRRAVEGPSSPAARVAAAAALARSLDEAGRIRVASAANESAAPAVRAALHRIASHPLDDETIEEAVASIIDRHGVRG